MSANVSVDAEARVRGQARRERLLKVTIELIAHEGVDAVTHRRVAELAGVPLGSTTYYFATRDRMLVEAMQEFDRQEIEAVRARFGDLDTKRPSRRRYVTEVVDFIAPQLGEFRWRTLAQYTLLCEAARRPELEALQREWIQAWVSVFQELFHSIGASNPQLEARMLLAMLDGFLVEQLAAPDADFVDAVLKPALRRAFDGATVLPRNRGPVSLTT